MLNVVPIPPRPPSPGRFSAAPHLTAAVAALGGAVLAVSIAAIGQGEPPALAAAAALATACIYAAITTLVLKPLERHSAELGARQLELEAMALDDALTGLPNKRAFEGRLDAELRRAKREYYSVALVAMDVDRFKQINDSWGHGVGDEALMMVARKIQAELRAGDFCGRVGGDEFMICLARADAQSAGKVLDRLRAALVGTRIGPDGHHQITYSAGIAEFPRHASQRGELMKRADAALYSGKAGGRDRWAVYRPRTSDTLSREQAADGIRRRGLVHTLQALAKGVDGKNRFTQHHSEHVAVYAVALAELLEMADDRVAAIRQAALLHDVGKIGIAEQLVVREGALGAGEAAELERHSLLGRDMLAGAGLFDAAKWVFHLHERYDGDGYPEGLAGAYIPVESRILHVADTLDHLTRAHPYRRHRPLDEALLELRYNGATRLDPQLVEFMIELVESGKVRVPGHARRARRAPNGGPRPRTLRATTSPEY
jgi:diguanylate cyclase (GGDEF)-like protein